MANTLSAAAKVFAINELLDSILLHVASDAVNSNTDGRRLEPMQAISAIQRVSKAFYQATAQSTKLRLWMKDSCDHPFYDPAAAWLLNRAIGINSRWENPESMRCTLVSTLDLTTGVPQCLHEHFKDQKFAEPTASWRCVSFHGINNLLAKAVVFNEVIWKEGLTPYKEELNFDGDVQLGTVYERVAEVLERTEPEHKVALRRKFEGEAAMKKAEEELAKLKIGGVD